MNSPVARRLLTATVLVALAGCSRPAPEPATPPPAKAAEPQAAAPAPASASAAAAWVRKMSDRLASAQAMSFTTAERHERVRRSGERVTLELTRQSFVKRPDGLSFVLTGKEPGVSAWYDGKSFTLALHPEKVYSRLNTPATLDETLDFLAEKLDVPMPMADLLYSSPHDSLLSADTTGGEEGEEAIDGKTCHRVSFSNPSTDWQLWVSTTADPVPCRIRITYKSRKGAPVSDITFKTWDLAAVLPADAFKAQVPAGYERIPMVVAGDDTESPAAAAEAPPAAEGQAAPAPTDAVTK